MHFTRDNIELFLAVLDHGSFSAAARALRRVPSAVSMAVANMEAELGYALFDRSRREPMPTDRALALAPHVRATQDQLTQLHNHALALSRGLESRLSIGVVTDVNPQALLRAVNQLSRRYPLLEVEMIQAAQDEIVHLLQQQRISLALAWGGLQVDGQLQFQWVDDEALVATLAADHPLLAEKNAPRWLEDLIQVRQIVVASRDRPLADARAKVATSCWYADSFAMALEMVEAGLGWGNFPQTLIAARLAQGELVRLRFGNTENALRLPVHLIWNKAQPLGQGARELVALMRGGK
ncbi:LysR family transcriptional regulator [Enterobacteriaceae bacterium BIT-l23]|uniref:LysR family transcriptional regulator n=1 Tax=Jejubacter sp. L23 TaxID=3092086 RepID=UPI00158521C6|nr:LysR family transcriptional regulator [Enterobacteriaceae bacterium BIT-l23]